MYCSVVIEGINPVGTHCSISRSIESAHSGTMTVVIPFALVFISNGILFHAINAYA